jgi:hypothetical protein
VTSIFAALVVTFMVALIVALSIADPLTAEPVPVTMFTVIVLFFLLGWLAIAVSLGNAVVKEYRESGISLTAAVATFIIGTMLSAGVLVAGAVLVWQGV